MPIVIKVEIRRTKDVFSFIPGALDFSIGDMCIVQTENGMEAGKVVSPENMLEKSKKKIYRVTRKMTEQDFQKIKDNARRARDAFVKVMEKVRERELEMKLIAVDYTFDRSKLFIYYTAEGRIDFRELVKDLGHMLKTRIQMVQVGVRDETKMIGGYGHCGRQLCCCSFIKDFNPVTIEMAKEQEMSLNPAKISGICGRLMCCLAYEDNFYKNIRKDFPKIDSKVSTKSGSGVVKEVDIFKRSVTVKHEDGSTEKIPVSEISKGILSKLGLKKEKKDSGK